MKKFSKVLAVILAAMFVVACFAGCSSDGKDSGSDKKVLTLATSADFPPYESVGDDGNYVGIDIEFAQAIADKLGYELKVENMNFDSVITSVASGKADMGMAGITVTEERLQTLDFSNPYAKGIQSVIVKADSPITSVDDLYAEGAKYNVGGQIATTGAIYFQGDVDDAKTTCTFQAFPHGADAVQALETGKLDAIIIDNQPAQKFVENSDDLKLLDTAFADEDYAVALPKDGELNEAINKAVDELVADGTVQKIVDKFITAK